MLTVISSCLFNLFNFNIYIKVCCSQQIWDLNPQCLKFLNFKQTCHDTRQKITHGGIWTHNLRIRSPTRYPIAPRGPKLQTFICNLSRQRQGSNLRGQSPMDFKSISLTTRTRCRATIAGIEPARAKPNCLAGSHLNHSVILSISQLADLNRWPQHYKCCALTIWAKSA